MKRISILFTSVALIFAASCSSTKNASTSPDDIYYSAGDHQNQPQPATAVTPAPADYSQENSNYNPDQNNDYNQSGTAAQNQRSSTTEQYSDDKGNTYITNNYYDDDYYDYEYSARLRRYYSPAIGYGYYDPFYTNSYWYDYNPYNYGVSIYLGYNWWAPSYVYYSPFCYGPVFPYQHFGYYDPWYNPYGYYGYNNYWHGYNNGYWDGYYNGLYASAYNNPFYYNSYDGNSTYYGPRGSISTNGKSTSPSPRATIGEKYQQAVAEHNLPVLAPQGVTGTQGLTNPGGGRGNINTGTVQQSGKENVSPINSKDQTSDGKNAVSTDPSRGTISDKNATGGKNQTDTKPTVDPSSYSSPGKTNTTGVNQNPRDNGGTVRPNFEQPQRDNNLNNVHPKANDVNVNPRNNGGTVRPNVEPGRNQDVHPRNSQPRSNSLPRNNGSQMNNDNTFGQPRNENVNPQQGAPEVKPRQEQPRINSYERPRQDVQPRIEPRQEPRQYKQENAPRQKESISIPAPRQQNSNPTPRNNNPTNENKGGGRRK